MNKFLSLLLMILLMTGCEFSVNYRIEGKAPFGIEGDWVYLQRVNESLEFENIDSCKVDDGTFFFQGILPLPEMGQVSFRPFHTGQRPIPLVLENGNIYVEIDRISKVKGSKLNDSLDHALLKTTKMTEELRTIARQRTKLRNIQKLTPEINQKLNNTIDSIRKEYRVFNKQFINNNLDNVVGAYVFTCSLKDYDEVQILEILNQSSARFENSAFGQKARKRMEALARTRPGTPFMDITLLDTNLQPDSLSRYIGKGKYILLDVWASWCLPCRKGALTLVPFYDKNKGEDFEIVGISLDNNAEIWTQNIEKMNLTWPQLSELKHWQGNFTTAYGIHTIPAMILYDPTGKLVAMNPTLSQVQEILDGKRNP